MDLRVCKRRLTLIIDRQKNDALARDTLPLGEFEPDSVQGDGLHNGARNGNERLEKLNRKNKTRPVSESVTIRIGSVYEPKAATSVRYRTRHGLMGGFLRFWNGTLILPLTGTENGQAYLHPFPKPDITHAGGCGYLKANSPKD